MTTTRNADTEAEITRLNTLAIEWTDRAIEIEDTKPAQAARWAAGAEDALTKAAALRESLQNA